MEGERSINIYVLLIPVCYEQCIEQELDVLPLDERERVLRGEPLQQYLWNEVLVNRSHGDEVRLD
jgi:hypothetical protein